MSAPLLSLHDLIAWLETKEPDESYDYCATGGCLLFRYLKERGLPVWSVGGAGWTDANLGHHKFPGHVPGHHFTFANPANIVAGAGEHTFGAALQRARALLETQP